MGNTLGRRLKGMWGWLAARREPAAVLGSGALIVLAWGVRLASGGLPPGPLYAQLMTGATAVAGARVASEALARLRVRQFSIALLVTVAATGAVWIGEAWEAAAVTFLYVLGGYLESITLARTRSALRGLVDLAPRQARVVRSGEVAVIAPEEVRPGETVAVFPGDRVPVDGKVVGGRAALDTAPLTGEPLPVEVGPGDFVLSGSVSRGGHLEIEAVRVGPDTTFSRLIYLVAESQEQRPKVQRMLDAFARWYTPLIIAASGGLLAVMRDLHLSLTFLVIACPGALVMASPVAVVAGLGHAARRGILIKGGERLERIARLDTVALDKTGTLTVGRPVVQTVLAFAEDAAGDDDAGGGRTGAVPADGVLADGVPPDGVAAGGRAIGLIGITDPVRPEARRLAAELRRAGIRHTVMLTGDNQRAAARVAGVLGIDEVRAGLLPEEKVAAIRELQAQGRVVGMVGDGVNDAPALAAADVSIAMGASGTQAAVEAADIALMTDRLEQVPYAIGLSRRILSIVRQNVAFAVAVVGLLILGVVGRQVHLAGGMLVHEASVMLVIANGMRLLGPSGPAAAARLQPDGAAP